MLCSYQFHFHEHDSISIRRNDTFGYISNGTILVRDLANYIPRRILELLVDYFPSARLAHGRYAGKLAHSVAKGLVTSKAEALLQGETNRDILSLLGTHVVV